MTKFEIDRKGKETKAAVKKATLTFVKNASCKSGIN